MNLNKKDTIFLITEGFNELGGNEQQVVILATELVKRNYKVFLLNFALVDSKIYYPILVKNGVSILKIRIKLIELLISVMCFVGKAFCVPIYALLKLRNISNSWKSLGIIFEWRIKYPLIKYIAILLLGIYTWIKKNKIFHIYNPGGYFSSTILKQLPKYKIPVFYTEVSEGNLNYFGLDKYINNVNAVIVPSRKIADNILKNYHYTGQIEIIPFMVREPTFKKDRENANIENSISLGCIARLVNGKGHKNLLSVVSKLISDGKKLKLILAGDGPLRNELENEVASLSIQKNVKFWGAFDNFKELDKIMAEIDIFVLFSDTEGQPTSIIEAMAYSKPVIATKVGGIPDLVEDGKSGILVEKQNTEELSSAILKLYNNKELRENMGKYGRKLYEENYHPDKVMKKVIEIYNKVIDTYQK